MSLKISRVLHAGYVFECNDTQIIFDPIFENPFSRNCYAFPNVKFDYEQIKKLNFAAVFISHYHDDHCSFESLNLLNRQTPIYIYCIFDEMIRLIQDLGFMHVYSLKLNESVCIGAFEITVWPALDVDVDSIFQIKAAGLNILNVVDSWIDSETLMRMSGQPLWDMILWPFQTMREIEVLAPSRADGSLCELPTEWLEQLKILKPTYIVPSSCQFQHESWSWYNHALFPISYQQFEKQIQLAVPGIQVVRLNPSVSIILNKIHRDQIQTEKSLSWVIPVGDQNRDYDYNPQLKPPSIAAIAQNFFPLNQTQTEIVFAYCRQGVVEKYNSTEPSEDTYFKKPQLWKLSVYDHSGRCKNFFYKMNNHQIEYISESDFLKLTENQDTSVTWLTEVPISKFFAALTNGESLTSMYLRVNDFVFNPEIEIEISAADIIEDPLIRCLFKGEFASYQQAQLRKLLNNSKLKTDTRPAYDQN